MTRPFSAALVGALLFVGATASAAPPAQESGWYGGLDAARSRLGFGYRFGPAFTIEGSYGRHDRQRYDSAPAAPWASGPAQWPTYGMSARYSFTNRLFGGFEWDRYGAASELDAFRRGDDRYLIRFGLRF